MGDFAEHIMVPPAALEYHVRLCGNCTDVLMRRLCDRTLTWRRSLAILVLAWVVVSPPANAQDKMQGKQFKDWTVACEEQPNSEQARCFLFQNIVTKNERQRILHVAVGYLAADGRTAAILTLPLGISLPPGVDFRIDSGETKHLILERCDKNGCRAGLVLEDVLVAAMKRGEKLQVQFHDAARRAIEVPVSLAGFTAGLAALKP